MTIQELHQQLGKLIKKYGNLPVLVNGGESFELEDAFISIYSAELSEYKNIFNKNFIG